MWIPHWSVRAGLAGVLGTLPTDLALPRLRAMLEDADRRVIPAVLSALVAVRAPEAAALSLELLQHEDAVIRTAAPEQLGLLRPPEGIPALVSAYRTSAGAAASAARLAMVDALARYGSADAVAALRTALSDDEWLVRMRVAGRLAELDPANAYGDQIGLAPGVSWDDALRLADPDVSPQVFLDTDKGTIQIELAVIDAPVATDTFASLAASGYFDGLPFHEVVANGFVRGGDPRGDGHGGPGYTIRDEVSERPFLRGTVGLARDAPEAGGSQFFITLTPQPQMDARYTVLGRVISGMEVVDRLAQWDVIRRTRVWDGVSRRGR